MTGHTKVLEQDIVDGTVELKCHTTEITFYALLDSPSLVSMRV